MVGGGGIPSLPDCFRTPTGTMTVGGGELRTPDASACCRGGMVEQYSAGLLGFGLWLLTGGSVSHNRAARQGTKVDNYTLVPAVELHSQKRRKHFCLCNVG